MGRRINVMVGLVLVAVTIAAAPATASPDQEAGRQVVITRLPVPEPAQGGIALDVNNRGQVVGQLVEVREGPERPELVGHPVLWDRGRPTDLAPHVEERRGIARFVNDRGDVALSIDGRAAIWRRGRLIDLGGDAVESDVLALNERGEALVIREYADGTVTIVVWRDGAVFQPSSPLGSDVPAWAAVLSDGGHVGVASRTPGCAGPDPCPAHLWYRGTYTAFPDGQFDDEAADVVNRSGHVLGWDLGGDVPRGVVRDRTGAVVTELRCPEDAADERPHLDAINDRGQVAGGCLVREGEDLRRRTVLWDRRGEPRWLPTLGFVSTVRALNERGDVIGETGNRDVLWSGGEMYDMGPAARLRALDDRGLVVGESEGQPVVWRLREG